MQLKTSVSVIFLCILCFASLSFAEQSYPGRPTNKEMLYWMERPCLETLAKVDFVSIDEDSFERDVIKSKAPVMVLFISDDPTQKGRNASRGMTALARALKSIHPGLKLAVWMVNESGFVSAEEFSPFQKKFELRNIPTLRFYDDPENSGSNQPRNNELDTGIIWDGDLLLRVDSLARDYISEVLFQNYKK